MLIICLSGDTIIPEVTFSNHFYGNQRSLKFAQSFNLVKSLVGPTV